MEVVPSDCSASSHALLGPAFSYLLSWCCTAGKLKQLSFIPTASLWPPDRSKLMPGCGAPTVHSKKFHQMTPFPTSLHIPTLLHCASPKPEKLTSPTPQLHSGETEPCIKIIEIYKTAIATVCLRCQLCYNMSRRPRPPQDFHYG